MELSENSAIENNKIKKKESNPDLRFLVDSHENKEDDSSEIKAIKEIFCKAAQKALENALLDKELPNRQHLYDELGIPESPFIPTISEIFPKPDASDQPSSFSLSDSHLRNIYSAAYGQGREKLHQGDILLTEDQIEVASAVLAYFRACELISYKIKELLEEKKVEKKLAIQLQKTLKKPKRICVSSVVGWRNCSA